MLLKSDPVNAFMTYDAVAVPSAPAGPLRGLTLAVKDIFDVAGYPTGGGSPIMQAESPVHIESAPIVAAMLNAGARFIGKTQTDELTFSMNGQNKHFPEPINVRAEGRITGGSSSGSAAAVAAGLCDFALGSDTGGSVRAPASYCGLWGIRPTHGRVDNRRAMPLAPSFDTAGYFADEPAVFAKVAPVFLGDDRKAFSLTRLFRADDAFARLISGREADALSPAVAKVESLLGRADGVPVAPDGLIEWYETFRRLQAVEAWKAHGAWITDRDPDMTPGVRERFEFGRDVPAGERAAADGRRKDYRARVEGIVGDDAVLMLPTVPTIAPKRDLSGAALQAYRERALSMLCIAGLSGLPQVSMPLAALDGCPLGLSLIGPRGADRALVALALEVAKR
ncbi:MAG: amidase [Propylenella sp.]